MDAAQDLGCTWMQAFWKVIIPEIKPGIISGALIAFTMSIDDFIISYFTAGSGVSTLAMTIYSMTKSGSARRSMPFPRCSSALCCCCSSSSMSGNPGRSACGSEPAHDYRSHGLRVLRYAFKSTLEE